MKDKEQSKLQEKISEKLAEYEITKKNPSKKKQFIYKK